MRVTPSSSPDGPPAAKRARRSADASPRLRLDRRQEASSLPTAADLFVRSLPGLDTRSSHSSLYAGNLPATVPSSQSESDSDAHLYFLLATNRHIPKRHRLLIWIQGGPGCSGFDGALLEMGPIRINKDGSVEEVMNTAWNEYANVLYLDQPAGTGFSYVTKHDDVRELAEAADQVVTFMSNLYKIFPEFANMDTYLAGESYAGQYIPYIATALLATTSITTPLKGLLIGNGWISPREQYPAYLDYLVDRKILEVDTPGWKAVKDSTDKCADKMKAMDAKNDGSSVGMVLVAECEEILSAINSATMKDGLCMNAYNVTEYQTCGAEWPDGLATVAPYLRKPDVVKALHARPGTKWEQCSSTVGSHFWTARSVPSVLLLPALLEKDIPVLLYNGDQDLMCAGLGIERMIEKMAWNGDTGFAGAVAQDWSVNQVLSGQWTTARGLSYVNFLRASHMVPIDQPVAAHDMLLRFMQVDTLHAAGAAARVPSRIGSEHEAVLGATSPDGSTLPPSLNPLAPPDGSTEKDVTEDGFDKAHEATFGPRRTLALVTLLVMIGFAIWAFFGWRARRRRMRYRRMKGKGRAAPSGSQGGIRLEETDTEAGDGGARKGHRSSLSAASLSSVRTVRPSERQTRIEAVQEHEEDAETTRVFDVGEDDEDESFYDGEEDGQSTDEDRQGDMGRAVGNNPWNDRK